MEEFRRMTSKTPKERKVGYSDFSSVAEFFAK